jgi:hypothetical protein
MGSLTVNRLCASVPVTEPPVPIGAANFEESGSQGVAFMRDLTGHKAERSATPSRRYLLRPFVGREMLLHRSASGLRLPLLSRLYVGDLY